MKNYDFVFTQFQDEFSDRLVDAITPDEIIFKPTNPRNRIMLECMARGGMRVGEVHEN